MDPERWRQVEALYFSVLERDPAERSAFLTEACKGDEDLKRKVQSMLATEKPTWSLLDRPAYVMLERPDQLTPGARLGPYHIESVLGEGGMGVVYRARDPKLSRSVAVKVLSQDLGTPVLYFAFSARHNWHRHSIIRTF